MCIVRRLFAGLSSILLMYGAQAAPAVTVARIDMPQARFATGDDPQRAQPGFDDSSWANIDTTHNYEKQGFDGYDGYSWYRIHVTIPSSLKAGSDWPQRLHVYLAAIDDTDETYLNGVLIGKTGRMPEDAGGFDGRAQALRNYQVDLAKVPVHWDQDNVIAIRVYDGVGGGGFYKDAPFLTIPNRADGLRLSADRAHFDFRPDGKVALALSVANEFATRQRGKLELELFDQRSGKALQRRSTALAVAPSQSQTLHWTLQTGPGVEAKLRFVDAQSGRSVTSTLPLPYLLTPADGPAPAIHGARVLGARPGTPLVFRIPATGTAPLHFAADDLPAGLTLDVDTGIIRGTVPAAGEYAITLRAKNTIGATSRIWTLQAGDQLALTPPLGWNSWNAFGVNVSDEKVRASARIMVDSGLAAKGWSSLNIDDGWQAEARAADGELPGNERFPDMASLGNYLHGLGLRFGIYSSPGPTTCGKFQGAYQHEAQDAATYARWGVDFLKYDLCSYGDLIAKTPTLEAHMKPFQLMGDALRTQPRSIVFSLCQYGEQQVWTWGPKVNGQAWRMTGDIVDSWHSVLETGFSIAPYSQYVAPGRWNDPDMLVVGHVGWGDPRPSRLTPDEQYSHISLWSMLAAPLLLGNDLSKLDAFTLNLLTNSEVLAINQDALGKAAARVHEQDNWQIWVKPLEDGSKAVGIFNMGDTFRRLRLDPAQYAMDKAGQSYQARDAWRQRALAQTSGEIDAEVPAHGVLLLTVR
ncbi:putative Ig domain-containing protein [Pseudoduganella sp. RAF19]|uniref:putative Ig domain-containing protein n=2 Tax=unclassified Pseudoduganella TaxID=2637179 RepID=UPI003F9D73B1